MASSDPEVNVYRSALTVLVMGLLIFAPLARGSVHLWAGSLIRTVAFAALAVMIARSLKEQVPVFPRTRLSVGMGILLLLAFVSVLFSSHKALAWDGFVGLFCYGVIFHAVVIVVQNRRFERGLVYVAAGMGFFVSLVGFLKWAGFNPFFWWEYPGLEHYKENFVTGVYVNQNHLAGFLEMTLPLVGVLFVTRRRRGEQRFILLTVLAVLLAALAMTFSVGGWLAAFCGLLFLLLTLKVTPKFLIFAFIAGVCLFAVTPTVEKVSKITGAYPEESFDARTRVWQGAWEMIKAHPWTGTGPSTFTIAYPEFQMPGMPVLSRMAHNDYLQMIAELGIFCIPVMIYLAGQLFFNGFTVAKGHSRQRRGFALGGMAGILCLLIHSLYHFNLHVPANAVLFITLAGIVVASETP